MELPDDIDDYGPDRFPPLSEEDEPEKLSETGVYIYNPDEDEDEEETEVPAGDPASIYRPEGEPMELPDDPDDYGPDRFPTSREEDESEHVPSEPTSNNGDEIYNPYADEDDEELEVPEGDPAFIYRPEGEPMELPDDPDDYGPDRFPPLPEEDEEVETPASDAENSSSTEEDTRGSFSNQRDRSLSHDDINDANYADDRGPRNSKGS